MYCVNCGQDLPDTANYCLKCGKPQKNNLEHVESIYYEKCNIVWSEEGFYPGKSGFFSSKSGSKDIYFWAKANGPNGSYNAGDSDIVNVHEFWPRTEFRMIPDSESKRYTGGAGYTREKQDEDREKLRLAFDKLESALFADGWQLFETPSPSGSVSFWWEYSYQRKKIVTK